MRGNYRRIFLNIFIMLAVIGAGISPACKFISGQQTWLEICGAEGIKKVLIASDEIPADEHQGHANSDPCAFCLTHASVKVMGAKLVNLPTPVYTTTKYSFAKKQAVLVSSYDATALPRGPPSIL